MIAAGFVVLGKVIDRLAELDPLPRGRGIAVFAAVQGTILCILSVRRLVASGGDRLAESGPYYAFRHPLALGCQLTAFGVALCIGSAGVLLTTGPLALAAWIGHALLLEEPALRRRFGDSYRLYSLRTGLLLPSTYIWSRALISVYYRLWCGLRIRGAGEVPLSGPFFLVSLHRCYMDPYLVSLGVPRKLHYIATSVLFRHRFLAHHFARLGCIPLVRSQPDLKPMMAAFKILKAGGAVALFPEGARSWYGETACEPAVFKVLDKPAVPIVTVEIEGAFEHHPRFAAAPRRRRISLRYRLHGPGSSQQIIRGLVEGERACDARLRALGRPQPARVAEQLLYVCPRCGAPFRCRGFADGRLVCGACGAAFALLEGKGLSGAAGGAQVVSLQEIESMNLLWCRACDPGALAIAGAYVHRRTPRNGADLQARHWLRRQDMKSLRPGSVVLTSEAVTADDGLDVRYQEIDSVLVESNWKVEISYRSNGAGRGYVLLVPPMRYVVFLQHFLRIRAFGNPYARYRGSARWPVAAGAS